MGKTFDVCVVGPTTLVGASLLEVLEERAFPVGKLYLLSGEEDIDESVSFAGKDCSLQSLDEFDFSAVQLAFFCDDAAVAREYVPKATAAGCKVIDDSDAFRMESNVPLVVPEVNGDVLDEVNGPVLIASPNSCATALATLLKPINDEAGVIRISAVTLQSVSGAGRAAVEELAQQATALFNQKPIESNVFPKQIAFNLLPHIGVTGADGYTREETKIIEETRKILDAPTLRIGVTAVRVPVFYGHALAVQVETRNPLTATRARALLEAAPGVVVYDDADVGGYPTPVVEAAANDPIFVGRIREDASFPKGLAFWAVVDNMRKGSALNCVQIAEILVRDRSVRPIM
jgi:aspartate-semialdehyde dehydrogenase